MSEESLRGWLRARLLGTVYATTPMTDDEVERTAKKIGVDVDLLYEVRADAILEAARVGRTPHRRHLQIKLWMPPPVHQAWLEEIALRGADGPTLLRSLVHEYLLGSREPVEILGYWIWEQKRYQHSFSWPSEQTVLPRGAWRALKHRALRLGVRRTPVIRALVLETLRGGHRDVTLVQSGHMFDDEKRYRGVPEEL